MLEPQALAILLFMTSALLMLSSSQNSGTFRPVCESRWVWIRDPEDCSRFWRCSWGVAIEMPRCPAGQVLNDALHVCVRRGSRWDDCPVSRPGGVSTNPSVTSPSVRTIPTTSTTTTRSTTTRLPPTTPRIFPPTQTPPDTTLGFSIFELCSRDFTRLVPQSEECQAYYNCSRVYDVVPPFFQQYLQECPYPQLFDSQRLVCDDFWRVDCGGRKEAVTPCDYRTYQCTSPSCTPCDRVLPSCVGKVDGRQAVSVTSVWTAAYVTCREGRTLSQGQCDLDGELEVPQVFSPVSKRCVNVYDVSPANGGLRPECAGRPSGTYSVDSGRRDLFYVCSNGQYMGIYRCPQNTVYNSGSKTCEPDTSPSFNSSTAVWEVCNRNATAIIPQPEECQSYYNCSLRKGVVPRWLENYLAECPYPQLFDVATSKCEDFWKVDCGARKEPLTACEYREYMCEGTTCRPCDVPVPSCSGKTDGSYPLSEVTWSPFYVICQGGDIINYTACDVDDNINVPQVFSPTLRQCVHLYDVPARNGGLQPDCRGRESGLYPEDNGREDLFYVCSNYQYNGIYRCPVNNYFDADSRQCRPTSLTTTTTTEPPKGTTLGFSIFELCSRDFTRLVPQSEECQAYYNCSRVYDVVPPFFQQYLQECPYPQLFDSQRMVCDDFWKIDCGARKEAVTACDYRSYQCPPDSACTPCDVVIPSCEGKADGRQAASVTSIWTAAYVTCRAGRTLSQGQCDRDRELGVEQVFSPITRSCVHLYDVPVQNGGLQPSCTNRVDGLYPEDRGRTDLYYACRNFRYQGIYRCPLGASFNFARQTCL